MSRSKPLDKRTKLYKLGRALEMEILHYRDLAKIAEGQPSRLTTLGDTASMFHGRAAGLHQALFLIDPEAAKRL